MFWSHWSQVAFSSICSLDLRVAVSSPDTEKAAVWFQNQQKVRKKTRLEANILPVLRLGLLRIDTVFWEGAEKVLHLQSHVKDAHNTSVDIDSG
jgi:hypothetical protein